MKIIKIKPFENFPICDNMLENGYYSDTLFDECFIEVTVDISDNILAPIFRTLWEDKYIKIGESLTRYAGKDTLIVGITLSEALGFIYKATPPHMKFQIEDGVKSVKDVVSSLEAFLLNDTSYMMTSMFCEHIHIGPITAQWKNFDKIRAGVDLITSILDRGYKYGFYVYASTHPIDVLKFGGDNDNNERTTVVMCTKLNLKDSDMIASFCQDILFKKEKSQTSLKVENVIVDMNDVYVGIVIDNHPLKGDNVPYYLPTKYRKLIEYSYKNVK